MAYLRHRYRWNIYPQTFKLTPFPEHIDIETSSLCQMNCPMCFQSIREDTPQGVMSMELFNKIIEEVAIKKPSSIRLSWRGECLLNPAFPSMLRLARSRYDGNISFLTNGLKLDEDLMDMLIDNEIDYIVISADGLGPVYEEVRAPGKFEDLLTKLKTLAQKKRTKKSRYPMVRINGVKLWYTLEELKSFIKLFTPVTDRLLMGDVLNNFDGPIKHDPERICSSPWQRLCIGWNGSTHPCCDDYTALHPLGNVNVQTIESIWHGATLNAFREKMKAGKRLEFSLCAERDCGIDENDNHNSAEYRKALRNHVTKIRGDSSILISYLETKEK